MTPAAPAAAGPVSQSLAQVATQRVNQQLQPQIAAQNAFNNRQASVIQSFARSLLGQLQPIAGQVGQDYQTAIQQTGALGNQAATFLQNQNPTGSVADLLKAVGAPQEQQSQIAGQLGQTFGGGAGVLSFTGAAIPGGQLAASGAAAQAQAAQLPGIAALKGQQDLSSALWQQGQDRQKLEAQRPALYQQAAQDIRTNLNAKATLAQDQNQFDINRSDKLAAANAKTLADQAGEHKQAAKDFLKLIYSPGFEAQNYSNEDLVAIAKEGFGLDLGKGFAAPVAPTKPVNYRITTIGNNVYAVNPTNPDDKKLLGAAKAGAGTWKVSVDSKTGKQYATNLTTGETRVLPGTKTASTSTTAPTTKKVNGVTYQWNAAGKTWEKSNLPIDGAGAKAVTVQARDFPNLTKAQVIHLRSGTANAFYGVPEQKDVNGKVVSKMLPPVDYETAITEAVKHGYSRAGATKMANRFYMPGQRGRPKRKK